MREIQTGMVLQFRVSKKEIGNCTRFIVHISDPIRPNKETTKKKKKKREKKKVKKEKKKKKKKEGGLFSTLRLDAKDQQGGCQWWQKTVDPCYGHPLVHVLLDALQRNLPYEDRNGNNVFHDVDRQVTPALQYSKTTHRGIVLLRYLQTCIATVAHVLYVYGVLKNHQRLYGCRF